MQTPDKLRIISSISKDGNFGEVFLCENTYLQRKEAVKYIQIKGKKEEEHVIEIKKNMFECSVLEYLRKSKYIVEIYDAEIIKDGFRINMEYLEKGSVQNLLNKKNFLGSKQILKISECILYALEYAHEKGILHLDVKPGNILIKNDNTYKLSDFGLANIREEDGTSRFKEIYNMHIPPEKLSNPVSKAIEQSDIYMLGVTLYRLVNGNSYLSQQWNELNKKKRLKEAIISGEFPDRKKYLPHVNKKIIKIVNKCLDVNLKNRYKKAREIRLALGKIKSRCNWVPKTVSEKMHRWECHLDSTLFLEIVAEKGDNGLWELTLMKYGKTKKVRVSKYSANKLKEKDFYKKFNKIFQEYF